MSAPPGHVPQPGQHGYSVGEGPTTNQAGFVNVRGRLYAPLEGVNPADVLMGGYSFLDWTDNGATRHPGSDLNAGSGDCNADEGLLVVAPLGGIVRAIRYAASGEGNHVWLELDDPLLPGPTWMHVDHLLDVSCREEQRLGPGEPIGLCGRSGGWSCAHLHLELLKGPPQYGYGQWPYGWSQAQVEAAYYRPLDWWNAATALVLAEANQPIPPEVVIAMTDWQLINWVLKDLYDWANLSDQFNANSGICKTWVAALRAGHYPGRPRTGERPFGSPHEGVWQECEEQLLVYRNDGEMSWTG
jgi:hypothetical protein